MACNGLLGLRQPEDVKLIGFADDIMVVAMVIFEWIEEKRLHLAPGKTELVLLTIKRKIGQISLKVQGTSVRLSKAIKYLGLWLNSKLTC